MSLVPSSGKKYCSFFNITKKELYLVSNFIPSLRLRWMYNGYLEIMCNVDECLAVYRAIKNSSLVDGIVEKRRSESMIADYEN